MNDKLFYTTNDIASILGCSKSRVTQRIRVLQINPNLVKSLKNGYKRYYSLDIVNYLISTWPNQKKRCYLIKSNFEKTETFIELNSKINNYGTD